MAKLSPVVSLYNLNQVYTELNNRIESLNTVYNPKGSIHIDIEHIEDPEDTSPGLKELTTHSAGDVWNVIDSFINAGVTIPADTNWVYVKTAPTIATKDYFPAADTGYWVRVGSFLDIARDDNAGLICTGTDLDSANNDSGLSFDRGLNLKGTTNKAYITIPAANISTYGVVTTGIQDFKGTKTFTEGVIVQGTIQTPAGSTPALAVIGKTETESAEIGLLDVENTLSVTGADPTGDTAAKTITFESKGLLTSTQTGTSTASTSAKKLTVSNGTLAVSSNSATAAKTVYLDVAGTTSVTDTTAAVFGLTAKTLSVPNGTLLVNGSNLTSTQWNAYSGVSGIATNAPAIISSLNVSGTANIGTLSMSSKTLTVNNDTIASYIYGASGSGSSVPAIWVNTAAKVNNLALLDGSTYKDLTVKNTVTTSNLYGIDTTADPDTSSGTVSEIWAGGTVKVNNLTLSNGAENNPTYYDLTVNNGITASALNGNSTLIVNGTATVGTLSATGTAEVGNVTLKNDSDQYQTLTVKNSVTTNNLTIPSGTIAVQGSSTATINNLTLINDSDQYQELTVKTGVTANALTISSGTIAIQGQGNVNVKNLILSNGAENNPTYYDLTVNSAVTASTLTAANANIQVTGTGTACTVGTLLGAAATPITIQSSYVGEKGGLNYKAPTRATTIPELDGTSVAANTDYSAALSVNGGGYFVGGVQAAKVFNAVWNDLSDLIEIDCQPEPGYAYSFDGEHYHKTTKYMDQGYIGIESDTSGFEMGGKGAKYELNASVAGFVLAYVDKEYKPGTPLTVTKDGKLTKIGLLGRLFHPEMVIATFWKKEPQKLWGKKGAEREVNGRMWVRIK